MNFDLFLKQLQDWTNKIPLIILGSGSSVPFGLPSMWALGEHLKETLSFDNDSDSEQLKAFKKSLEESNDLEKALLRIQIRERRIRP